MKALPDIAGDNGVHYLATPNAEAVWVQLLVSGSGTVRIAGAEQAVPSSSFGFPLVSGSGELMPWGGPGSRPYSLHQIRAYIPMGATLHVMYEPFN